MDKMNYSHPTHIGKKVAGLRDLHGLTQTQLGERLGITKQAVSLIEQSETLTETKITEIAAALGVTPEGLKTYNQGTVTYNNYNFHENCGVSSAAIGANHIEILNYAPANETLEEFKKSLEALNSKVNNINTKMGGK